MQVGFPWVITQVGENSIGEMGSVRYNRGTIREAAGRRLPIPDETALSDLLGLLYEAASNQTLWAPFLESIARQTDGHASAIVTNDADHRAVALYAGVGPELGFRYREHYHAQDIWGIRGIPQIMRSPGDWVNGSEELCSSKELRSTEFYNDFLLPLGNIGHAMFAVLKRDASRVTNLSVYRTPQQDPFGTQELRLIKLLSPHLRRAFRLQFQLISLQDRTHSFDMLLDSLPQGIILLGAKGGVLHMNRAARQFCEASDGLLASNGGLSAQSPAESAILQHLIRQAISTSSGDGLSPGGGMEISRQSGISLNVVVSPVRGLATDFREPVRAVVYVTDLSARVRPRNELLQDMFSLTPAECRIALLIADGLSASQIRDMAGITGNTLRTHLASIYRKTNTQRQTQLVKLVGLIGMSGR